MNKNFEDTAKKYKDEMMKLYQQQKNTKSNNENNNKRNNNNGMNNNGAKQNNNKNSQSTQNNQANNNQISSDFIKQLCPGTQIIPPKDDSNTNNPINNNQTNMQNNQENMNIQPPMEPMRPLCPGTQIIPPPDIPTFNNMQNNSNNGQENNKPEGFQQSNMDNDKNLTFKGSRCPGSINPPPEIPANLNLNNQVNDKNTLPIDEDEDGYVPPTRPRCPATQPIEPVIPAANNMINNNSDSNNNSNAKYGQWNVTQSNNNTKIDNSIPLPPRPFRGVIPTQLTPIAPEFVPVEPDDDIIKPNMEIQDTQNEDPSFIIPGYIPPIFPVGETGGESIFITETDDMFPSMGSTGGVTQQQKRFDTSSMPEDINSGRGELKVITRTASNAFPVKDAVVIVEKVYPDGSTEVISSLRTNSSGVSPTVSLPAPPKKYSLTKQDKVLPFAYYDILVSATGFYKMVYKNVPIFDGVQSIQPVDMIPISLDISNTYRIVRYVESGE